MAKFGGQKFTLHHNVYYFTALLCYIFVIFQQIILKIVSFTSFNAFFAAVALMILVEKQPLFQIFFFYNHLLSFIFISFIIIFKHCQ